LGLPNRLILFGHCVLALRMLTVPIMEEPAAGVERRQNPRHPISSAFQGQELGGAGAANTPRRSIRGKLQDISAGGLCLRTNQHVKVAQLVRASIVPADVPVGVPSLMRVCWVRRLNKAPRYRIGLQFLL
jgi:c-di-GMP-binding flagellar brake protein YcgR